MCAGGNLALRPAVMGDIPYVVAREADASASRWIEPWSLEQHQEAMAGRLARHLIAEIDHARVGFLIAVGPTADGEVELRRLVVYPPGAGLGRLALSTFLWWSFADDCVRRVWLDVFQDNGRARALYSRLGLVPVSVTSVSSERRLEVWAIDRDEWMSRSPTPGWSSPA